MKLAVKNQTSLDCTANFTAASAGRVKIRVGIQVQAHTFIKGQLFSPRLLSKDRRLWVVGAFCQPPRSEQRRVRGLGQRPKVLCVKLDYGLKYERMFCLPVWVTGKAPLVAVFSDFFSSIHHLTPSGGRAARGGQGWHRRWSHHRSMNASDQWAIDW